LSYVREEFNRAEALENAGSKGTVGFALTILQRRLASSPEAIYQSLKRRRERLEKRLREEQLLKRGAEVQVDMNVGLPALSANGRSISAGKGLTSSAARRSAASPSPCSTSTTITVSNPAKG